MSEGAAGGKKVADEYDLQAHRQDPGTSAGRWKLNRTAMKYPGERFLSFGRSGNDDLPACTPERSSRATKVPSLSDRNCGT